MGEVLGMPVIEIVLPDTESDIVGVLVPRRRIGFAWWRRVRVISRVIRGMAVLEILGGGFLNHVFQEVLNALGANGRSAADREESEKGKEGDGCEAHD